MRSVRIYDYQIGLVFRKGNYLKTLTSGKHWIRLGDRVKRFDMTKEFLPPCELSILLQDSSFTELIHLLTIKDNEIGLVYIDDKFKGAYGVGKYVFWKSIVKYDFETFNLDLLDVPQSIHKTILQRKEILAWIRSYTIQAYEIGILLVDGQYTRKLNPGTHYFWINSQPVSIMKADMRQQHLEINGQEILTKDKANLRVNFDAQYRMVDVEKALIETGNYTKQLYATMQYALRVYLGTLTLDELLARKTEVVPFILEMVKGKLEEIGIEILGCGIKDIILPGEVKEILNQVLIAEKRAQANIITRREETASTRSLLNTAKLMENNEMLFKLKEMEYVEKIADKINSISLSGGGQLVEQLRQIFGSKG